MSKGDNAELVAYPERLTGCVAKQTPSNTSASAYDKDTSNPMFRISKFIPIKCPQSMLFL
jgi:hypothetical protein